MSIQTPLYELVRYRKELETLADSGDVPAEQIVDTLTALDGDINDKAVQVAAFTRNLDATASAIREAAKAMLTRADRVEKRAQAIRDYLLFEMQIAGISKIESEWFTIARRTNPPAVVVDDPAALPEQYMVQPPAPPPLPDKASIAKALKAGEDVPGCRLSQSDRIEIKE